MEQSVLITVILIINLIHKVSVIIYVIAIFFACLDIVNRLLQKRWKKVRFSPILKNLTIFPADG